MAAANGFSGLLMPPLLLVGAVAAGFVLHGIAA